MRAFTYARRDIALTVVPDKGRVPLSQRQLVAVLRPGVELRVTGGDGEDLVFDFNDLDRALRNSGWRRVITPRERL